MKNIKTVFLFSLLLLLVQICYSQNGWTNLFDGKTLDGWKKLGGTADYKVENGMMKIAVSNVDIIRRYEPEFGIRNLELREFVLPQFYKFFYPQIHQRKM